MAQPPLGGAMHFQSEVKLWTMGLCMMNYLHVPLTHVFIFFELIVPPTLDQALQYQYVSGKSLFLDVTM